MILTRFSWCTTQAVDRFINGDYYRHPLSAEAILDVVLELRVSWFVLEGAIRLNIVVGSRVLHSVEQPPLAVSFFLDMVYHVAARYLEST